MTKEEIKMIIKKYIKGSKHPILNNAGILKEMKGKHMSYQDIYTKRMHKILKQYENNMYDYLSNILGKNFEAYQLYNYLYDIKNFEITDKNKFINLNIGYKDALYKVEDITLIDLSFLNTKLKVYQFLCENKSKHYNLSYLKQKTNLLSFFPELKQINNQEELFCYLLDRYPNYCEICGEKTQFISFYNLNRPYKQFCCNTCRQIWWSNQQHENNTSYRMSDETRKNARKQQSEIMKQKIANGEWTPNATNSWCRSKIILKYKLNNQIIQKNMRSSWEVFFQLLYPTYEYEKLRIPYINSKNNTKHIYIVDFIDYASKQVFEIKPAKTFKNSQLNQDKAYALKNWCILNNYTMNIITEEFFKNQVFNTSLLTYTDQYNKEKIIKLFKQNKFNIKYEN